MHNVYYATIYVRNGGNKNIFVFPCFWLKKTCKATEETSKFPKGNYGWGQGALWW